jgi:hypothetical protein
VLAFADAPIDPTDRARPVTAPHGDDAPDEARVLDRRIGA